MTTILFGRQPEGRGKKRAQGCRNGFARSGWVEDGGLGVGKLRDGLAAGAAGHAGRAVQVDDGGGADAYGRAIEGDGSGDGGLFGAGGKAIGGVLNIRAGHDPTGLERVRVEQDRRANAEVAVRRVGILRGFGGPLVESGDFRAGQGSCRHRA